MKVATLAILIGLWLALLADHLLPPDCPDRTQGVRWRVLLPWRCEPWRTTCW